MAITQLRLFPQLMTWLGGDTELAADSPAKGPFAPVDQGSAAQSPLTPAAYYERHIAPLTEAFEFKRREAVDAFWSRVWIAAPTAFAVTVLWAYVVFTATSAYLMGNNAEWFVGGLLCIAGCAIVYCSVPLWQYDSILRTEVFPKIFRYFGRDFTYREHCPWKMSTLAGSELLPSFDEEELEDYVHGSYKGVSVEMVEAELRRDCHVLLGRQNTLRRRRRKTVFDGVLFVITPKKRFRGKIVIKRDSGTIVNAFNGFVKQQLGSLQRVRLEDPEFERRFEIYATDQVEARTVLTTSFMQRLIDLDTLIGHQAVDCSFFENKLLIRIATEHDYFEPGSIFRPVDFQGDFEKLIGEMDIVLKIVDTLRLDMDIGL